jgi:2-keto-4-pentenoate hydratase
VTDLDALAAVLTEAYAPGRATLAPLTSTCDGLTVDDAYAIQQLQVGRRVAGGVSVIGYKVGLTSTAMQQQMGVYEGGRACQ